MVKLKPEYREVEVEINRALKDLEKNVSRGLLRIFKTDSSISDENISDRELGVYQPNDTEQRSLVFKHQGRLFRISGAVAGGGGCFDGSTRVYGQTAKSFKKYTIDSLKRNNKRVVYSFGYDLKFNPAKIEKVHKHIAHDHVHLQGEENGVVWTTPEQPFLTEVDRKICFKKVSELTIEHPLFYVKPGSKDVRRDKIVGINFFQDEKPVYNLTTSTRTYVANGFLVHNKTTGGTSYFVDLIDTPSGGLTGEALKLIRINATETDLEYVNSDEVSDKRFPFFIS